MSSTSRLALESRLPVGSSARIMVGSVTSARAIATRCCWPPESWFGRCCDAVGQPHLRERVQRHLLAIPRGRDRASGSSTLRHADIDESRWNCWKTKPMRRLRMLASSRSFMRLTSSPANRYSPLVGTSRHPRMCMSVDLPDPEGPITARKSPSLTDERHVVDRAHRRVAAAVDLAHIDEADDLRGHISRRCEPRRHHRRRSRRRRSRRRR